MDDPNTKPLNEEHLNDGQGAPAAKIEPVSSAEPETAKPTQETIAEASVSMDVTLPKLSAQKPQADARVAPVKKSPGRPRKVHKSEDMSAADAAPASPSPTIKRAKAAVSKIKRAVKRTPKKSTIAPARSAFARKPIQELTMTDTITTEASTEVLAASANVQYAAKSAFQRGAALAGELGTLTKGNVAAVTESGKILRDGLQVLGTGYVKDGRAAFETLSSEVRELAAVKSPFDFLKLQGEFVRRNFQTAFDLGSKNSKAILALAQDAAAPLTRQAKVAVDTVRKVA